MRPINLDLSAKSHDQDFMINPGHKAVITQVKTDEQYIVTGAKNGEVKVLNFNVFK